MSTSLLTGPAVTDLLGAALRAEGAELRSWTIDRVHARPGAEVSVGYVVDVRRGDVTGTDYLVATTAPLDPDLLTRPGTVRLDGPRGTLHVWRHPADPALTPLATASDVAALTAAWRRVDPAAPTVHEVDFVAYRPLRRAVLRATTSAGEVYLKVVRPERAAVLRERHALFETSTVAASTVAADPVAAPRVLAEPVRGLMVLEALTDPSVVAVIAESADQAHAVDPAEVVAALAALPDARHLPHRPPWSARAAEYAGAAVTGWGLTRATAVADAVERGLAETPAGPVVTTHGDPHGANLLVAAGGRIGSLLDVDTLGPGHRVDDLACFVAHLLALPALDPGRYPGVPRLVERTFAAFDRLVDPRALRVRVAGVLLSLVPGAPTADVAATWLDLAARTVPDLPVTTGGTP